MNTVPDAGAPASQSIGVPATAARPSLTAARASSPSAASSKPPALQQDSTCIPSRFAAESAQRPLDTAPSLSTAFAPINTADPDLSPQSVTRADKQQPSALPQAHSSLRSRMQDSLQDGSQAGTSSKASSRQQAQAASSTSDYTSPDPLRLPFGLCPTPTPSSAGPSQAPPSAVPSAHLPQPGTPLPATGLPREVPLSVKGIQGLSLRDKLALQHGGMTGKQSMLRWEPACTPIDSPEKQELGRRECL